ncbi:MAG: hypothetical protein Q4C36_10410, partial [Coriobacteriia bacterium]|nr:hypothetical protein [Coriobacteriia bacterium]
FFGLSSLPGFLSSISVGSAIDEAAELEGAAELEKAAELDAWLPAVSPAAPFSQAVRQASEKESAITSARGFIADKFMLR